jgi:tetratricopeptide (TPR) repeat protein
VDLLAHFRQHAAELHIDASAVILWACSANVRAGLPLAMDPRQTAIKAAVFYYGVTGEIKEVRPELPILVVRAGLDGAGLNRGIEQLVARATAVNAPLTFINIPGAHHAFDVFDNNETSREAISRTLDFMKTQIPPSLQRDILTGVPEATAVAAVYRGDWAAAVKAYEGLAASRPGDPEVHRNFGNALSGVGQFNRALGEYQRALEPGNPNVGWVSYSAASASMKLGDTDAALKWIEKLRDIPPMRRQLSSDPDFASLKDNPRFKAIAELN